MCGGGGRGIHISEVVEDATLQTDSDIIVGHCQARDRIEVVEAGSEPRVTTKLRVGSSEADDPLRKEVRNPEAELSSRGKMIGRRTHEHLSALPERTSSRLRLAITEPTAVMETLEALKLRQSERKGLDADSAEIIVRNCALPGVTIMIKTRCSRSKRLNTAVDRTCQPKATSSSVNFASQLLQ